MNSHSRVLPAEIGLRISNLKKVFGGKTSSVRIGELQIAKGEFVSLVGPSGCGKTTTMRMVAGLEEPTEGEIFFGDRLVNDISVQNRNIAMVFQNYALYPHLSASENLQYGLKKRRVPRDERLRRVAEVAQLLRIEHLLQRKPREMSGGEQQRVALGRAIIRTPEILLLDEPLSNLDAKLRSVMRVELVKLHRRLGCTTVFVTHDQLEAMTMSDRIAVMNGGEVQQFAKPADVYDRPANLFVAGFIGSPAMNFLQGELSERSGKTHFAAEGLDMTLDMPVEKPGGPGSRATTLGIRPENIEIDPAAGDLSAIVAVVELIGAEKYVFLETPAGQIVVRERADAELAIDQRVHLRLDRRKIRLFDTGSGSAYPLVAR